MEGGQPEHIFPVAEEGKWSKAKCSMDCDAELVWFFACEAVQFAKEVVSRGNVRKQFYSQCCDILDDSDIPETPPQNLFEVTAQEIVPDTGQIDATGVLSENLNEEEKKEQEKEEETKEEMETEGKLQMPTQQSL